VALLEGEGLVVEELRHYEQYQEVDDWLATTGAPEDNRLQARELLFQSVAEDLAGLGLFIADGRLMMTHDTVILVARRE